MLDRFRAPGFAQPGAGLITPGPGDCPDGLFSPPLSPVPGEAQWSLGGGDPNVCAWLLGEEEVDSCDYWTGGQRSFILSYSNDESFRASDWRCMRLPTTLEGVLSVSTGAGVGMDGSKYGAAVWFEDPEEIVGVWFHAIIFSPGYSYTIRRRVVYHEAAHLAFLDDSDDFAGAAAAYCARETNSPPWGYES